MKTLLKTAAAALLFCSGISFAQNEFPSLAASSVPGLRLVREASYDGNSLWGYIDGGADVYLEYGFTKVLARKAEADGITFQIDLYKMHDADAAFGIFSIYAFTCSHGGDSLAPHQCLSRYQAQAVRGPYYLSVINDKGTSAAQALGVTIARALLAQIDTAGDLRLPEVFSRLDGVMPAESSVKFIKGRLGLQNGAPEFEKFFSDSSAYSLYIKEAHADSLSMALAVITFERAEGKNFFIAQTGFHIPAGTESFQEQAGGGSARCLWNLPNHALLFLDVNASPAQKSAVIAAVDDYLKHRDVTKEK